jgi:hypothetical protein
MLFFTVEFLFNIDDMLIDFRYIERKSSVSLRQYYGQVFNELMIQWQ